jgi:hypothetical protein
MRHLQHEKQWLLMLLQSVAAGSLHRILNDSSGDAGLLGGSESSSGRGAEGRRDEHARPRSSSEHGSGTARHAALAALLEETGSGVRFVASARPAPAAGGRGGLARQPRAAERGSCGRWGSGSWVPEDAAAAVLRFVGRHAPRMPDEEVDELLLTLDKVRRRPTRCLA